MTSSAVISVAWWSSEETVEADSERERGGGDICRAVGTLLSATARLTSERRERDVEDAEEGEGEWEGEVAG